MMNTNNQNSMFRLDGKVAIVTGGAGLLGEEHAIALSEFGAKVVLADINVEMCTQRAQEISTSNERQALGCYCDVTRKDSWQSLLDTVLAEFGQVDILVNNAAFTNQSSSANYKAPFFEFPLDDWNQIMNVNLAGSFLGCQVIGEQMLKQKTGNIVNIASLYGVVSPNHRIYPDTGIYQPVAYSVSKAGVIALTRYLATLWAEHGIRVNSITPGGVYNQHNETFMTRFSGLNPSGRMAEKWEMKGALIYLASDASSYCIGHNLVVDGGWTAW
jgi:NAD(P)-dependent dehydrogenase (short-subunit alcohol dehydrogenase family)